jgi:hypothetical protein
MRRMAMAAVLLLGFGGANAQDAAPASEDVRLQDDAPLRYTVKKGDTLWGIASKFLRDPYQWPEVWNGNTKVTNPHLIYPGQELILVFKDRKKPQLFDSGDLALANETEKLSPQVRELPLTEAIPTIRIELIRQFLRGPRVVSAEDLERAPYVVEFTEEHLLGSAGMGIYAKNVPRPVLSGYNVVRRGDAYRDPDNGDLLGYEAIPEADAEMREYGPLSILQLVESNREVNIGDRLLPDEAGLFEANFFPHAPAKPVGGRIISVYNGMSQIGQYQIVTLNRGTQHGIEIGHVLSIKQAGKRVNDPIKTGRVQLPDQYAGTLLVFKVSPRLSYGLVMSAVRAVHLLDKVEKPRPGEKR